MNHFPDFSSHTRLLKAERTERHPSAAQIKAGNYTKRKVPWRGMTISVENEAGSTRSGTDPGGKRWSIRMKFAYGYLKLTEGVDGDHVDVYLGPDLDTAPNVYVVHQRKVNDWKAYDEDKAMLGFTSRRAAVKAFLANYTDRRFLGPVTVMPVDEFIEKARATFNQPRMIKTFVGHSGRPGLIGWSVKRMPARDGSEGMSVPDDAHIRQVNATVNRQIEAWANRSLPTSTLLDLGRPSSILRRFGVPDKPIHLTQSVLRKATDKKHGLHPTDLKDLTLHIQAPLAVFKSRKGKNSLVVLTEITHEQGNLIAALDLNVKRLESDIHDIRSVHPKADAKVGYWLADGLLLGYAKDNGRQWLESSAPSNSGQSQAMAAIVNAIVYDRSHLVNVQDIRKSIVLTFPSGSVYWLFQHQYRWQVSALLLKALGPGERWITVSPNGKENKGVPVLVRETHGGSGVYHVIGGAGGKLNYLKMRGIKPEADYKAQAAERAAVQRKARQEQARMDRESGVADIKKTQRDAIVAKQREAERRFIEEVAKRQGWKEEDIAFDEKAHAKLSDAAKRKAYAKHHGALLRKANEAIDLQRQRLVEDPDFRAEAGLANMPAQSAVSHELSVADIDPVTPGKVTLGFSHAFGERAQQAGLSKEAIQAEAEATRDARLTPDEREARIRRGETRQAVKEELERLREPSKADALKPKLAEAREAVEMVKLQKQLQSIQKQAREARADVDKDPSGKIKTYNITVGGSDPDLDEKVREQVENDIRTVQTRTFLSAIRDTAGQDYEQSLNAAIGAGAFDSVNALAIAAGGAALVDRSVVDVLGPAGAARVLARRLHADLDKGTVDTLTEDFGDFHANHYMATSKAALEQAAELRETARQLELDEAHGAHDLVTAKAITERKLEALTEAHRLLATALGEMETNAALVAALKSGRANKPLEVALGGVSPEDAIRQARAIGLPRVDYRLDQVAGNEILTVTPEGLDRLARPIDVADLRRRRRTLDIMEGREDEENWLPKGVANRPDLAMPPADPGVASVLAKPFEPGADLARSLRDYIGGRMADGDAASDILADIQGKPFFDKAGDERFGDYLSALNEVAPLKDAKGRPRPIETMRPEFEAMADEFVAKHYGADRTPLHRQTFDPNDEKAAESLYRTLAEVPEGIAAFTPIGELTHEDRRALREFFHAHVAREDEDAAAIRHRLEAMSRHEPEREFTDMFGETVENPEWREWKNERDGLAEQANKASLTWDKYTSILRGHANAYATLQDMIRSRVNQGFTEHYNRAHPDKPLKRGRTPVRNSLAHADAIDPALREQRLDEQRQFNARLQARDRGQFASDDVIGKQQSARAAEEADKQAQFNLFGDDEPADKTATPLKADERYTLGHAAENQIARMVPMMARNFKPGQPFKMWQPSMNGKGVARQRAIKLVEANKRFALGLGPGSGKTLIQLGSISHLLSKGKINRALVLVPSIVQSEFRAEAARYLDPKANGGKGFNYHIEPGASRAERIAAYKDPQHHFAVMTHSAFRDDMIHMGAQQAGIEPAAMRDRLAAMNPAERKPWIQGVMRKEGIHFDYVSVDEFQGALNRLGKEDSSYANVLGALSQTTPYFVAASADLVKNDRCLHPDTPIVDAKTGQTKTVKQWCDEKMAPWVYALETQSGRVRAVKASVPFVKSRRQPMSTVETVGGNRITVAQGHRFLTNRGWQSLSGLSAGDAIAVHPHEEPDANVLPRLDFDGETLLLEVKRPVFALRSLVGEIWRKVRSFACDFLKISGPSTLRIAYADNPRFEEASLCLVWHPISSFWSLPIGQDLSVPFGYGRHYLDITQDSLGRCCDSSHPYGGQPRLEVGNDQESAPSQTCVPLQTHPWPHKDDLELKPECTSPTYGDHSSSYGASLRCAIHDAIRVSSCMANPWQCSNFGLWQGLRQIFRPFWPRFLHPSKAEEFRTDESRALLEPQYLACLRQSYPSRNILFDKIKSIIPNGYNDVYDLSVPVFHNYLACGIWNHNSEIFSLLSFLDPERYTDRGEFMRRYGADTEGSKRALKQELNRYVYSHKIDPEGVQALKQTVNVDLNDRQHAAIAELKKHLASARLARMTGKTDVAAIKTLMPERFTDVPEDQHEAVAKELSRHLGLVRESAMSKLIDDTGISAKYDRAVELANRRKGKPGIIFAHRIESVNELAKKLQAEGHAVTVLTGKDSPEEKAGKVREFRAKGGVLVASDAASTGMNAQNAKWVVQYDTPQTAMVHAQRGARAYRVGQTDDVELIDLVANHDHERQARDRLAKKYELRELMTSPLESMDDTGLAYYLQQRDSERSEN